MGWPDFILSIICPIRLLPTRVVADGSQPKCQDRWIRVRVGYIVDHRRYGQKLYRPANEFDHLHSPVLLTGRLFFPNVFIKGGYP
jgi:hypothetical protein